MKKILKLGITSLLDTAHLSTALLLGKGLKSRGHQVVYYGFVDAKDRVLAAGLEFCALAEKERPLGTYAKFYGELRQLLEYSAIKFALGFNEENIRVYLSYLPQILASSNVDAFIYDQALVGLFSIPESLNIPSIEFCNTVAVMPTEIFLHPTATVPFQDYSLNPFTLMPNLVLGGISGILLFGRWRKLINQFRKAHQLSPIKTELGLFQGNHLAVIAQLIPELDFPTYFLPRNFYYCGSFSQSMPEKDIPFPYEKLLDKPLIYACLGTMQNGSWELFKVIDSACSLLEVQLVLSFGKKGALSNYPIEKLSSNTIAVDYAPQKSLIRKSVLIITQAGLNSALEALWEAKPMVCIPISHDQPQVAARMKRAGVAEVLPLKKLTEERLHNAILKVLKDDKYKQNASFFQEKLRKTGGVARAVDIIETVVI